MLSLSFEVVFILVLIGINGVLAMTEIALVSSRRIRLQQRAERGDLGARAALQLADEPTRFLSTVQVGITLVGTLAGAFGGRNVADRIVPVLRDLGLGEQAASTLSFFIVVLCLTYLSIVFGELVPKRIGLNAPETVSSFVARPMQLLSRVGAPFVFILSVSTGFVTRLIGLRNVPESTVTEEELRLQISMSAESGIVEEEEAELLERVFHFGDRQVHEVMIPRTDAVWLRRGDTLSDFYSAYSRAPHSRFPVFEGNADKVVGILGIKDVLAALSNGLVTEKTPVDTLMRPAYFVPETKAIGELFREMQAKGVQMSVAVDEFGGTAGIVTLEQLIEEMVGPVGDELRPGVHEIREIDEHTRQVDGSLSIEEAREELEIDFPEGPYDTVAGYVLNQLGHIPVEGELVPIGEYKIVVAEMRGPKIEFLRVTRDEEAAVQTLENPED